jgi:hypothetical protein
VIWGVTELIMIVKVLFYNERLFCSRVHMHPLFEMLFNIFNNIKKFKTKMFYVHIHVLRACKVVSTKTNFLYGLYKNDKIWYSL